MSKKKKQSVPSTQTGKFAQGRKLMCANRWREAFDLLYKPQRLDGEHQQLMARFCIGHMPVNMLSAEQVERLQADCTDAEQAPTAAYLLGFWMLDNMPRLTDVARAEELLLAAARGGYADAWWTLRYMYRYGLNPAFTIDTERADHYEQLAEAGRSIKQFLYGHIERLFTVRRNYHLAVDELEQRIESDGGPDRCCPQLLAWLADARTLLGQPILAEDLARDAIRRGATDRGFQSLYYCLYTDGEKEREGTAADVQRLMAKGAACGSPTCMYHRGLYLLEQSATAPDEEQNAMQQEALLLLTEAASLGSYMACDQLVNTALKGSEDFSACTSETYGYLHRGALRGSLSCLYGMWLYAQQRPDCPDPTPVATWNQYGRAFFQAYGTPWPPDAPEEHDSTPEAPAAEETLPHNEATAGGEWQQCRLWIYWQADQHRESHCKTFARPGTALAADHPTTEPGSVLSTEGMPMADRWGQLFAPVRVKECSPTHLIIEYGTREITVEPRHEVQIATSGMNYTKFSLDIYLG